MTDPDWRTRWAAKPPPTPPPPNGATPIPAPNGGTPYGRAALSALSQQVAAAAEGTRNDTLNKAAFRAGQLIGGGEIEKADAQAALLTAARVCGLPPVESVRTIQSGVEDGVLDPKTAPPRPSLEVVPAWPTTSTPRESSTSTPTGATTPSAAQSAAGASASSSAGQAAPTGPGTSTDETPERTSWWPRDLGPVLDGRDEEPPPARLHRADGQALLYAAKVNGIIGESESGKTWLALHAVTQTLDDDGSVLYLDFEDTAHGIVTRLKAAGATRAHLANLTYTGPDESLHHAAQADLAESLTTAPDLVIVDGFNAAMTLMGLDINSNNDATAFSQRLLKPLARTGAVVVYVDHVPKNADNRGKGGIGAQAKRAMTTGCAISVEVMAPFGRGMKGQLRLTVDKDRPGHIRAAALGGRLIGTCWLDSDPILGGVGIRIDNAVEEAVAEAVHRREDLQESILAVVRKMGQIGSNQIAQAVRGKRAHILAEIAQMAADGALEMAAGPRNQVIYTLPVTGSRLPGTSHGNQSNREPVLVPRFPGVSREPVPVPDPLVPGEPVDPGDDTLRWDQR